MNKIKLRHLTVTQCIIAFLAFDIGTIAAGFTAWMLLPSAPIWIGWVIGILGGVVAVYEALLLMSRKL